MPFESKAQMRKFYADPKLRDKASEWSAATPNISALPEHVKAKPRALKPAPARKPSYR